MKMWDDKEIKVRKKVVCFVRNSRTRGRFYGIREMFFGKNDSSWAWPCPWDQQNSISTEDIGQRVCFECPWRKWSDLFRTRKDICLTGKQYSNTFSLFFFSIWLGSAMNLSAKTHVVQPHFPSVKTPPKSALMGFMPSSCLALRLQAFHYKELLWWSILLTVWKKNLAPRETNRRTWFYRIRPSVLHKPFERIESTSITVDFSAHPPNPNQV